jgi:hypothetical protein
MGAMERKGGSVKCRVFGKWGVGSMVNVRERSDAGGFSEADGYCIRRDGNLRLHRADRAAAR